MLFNPKYNLPSLLTAYHNNKSLLDAHIRGRTVEHNDPTNSTTVVGLSLSLFLLLLFVSIAVWVWALVLLISKWGKLDTWAQVLGILALLTGFGGPVVTLIIVYIDSAGK